MLAFSLHNPCPGCALNWKQINWKIILDIAESLWYNLNMINDPDEMIKLRSTLGKWYRESDRTWYKFLVNENAGFGDSKQFKVLQLVEFYKPLRRYNVTQSEMMVLVNAAKEQEYIQTEFSYPQLQEFFRNGMPVTVATRMADAFDASNLVAQNDPFETLMNSLI